MALETRPAQPTYWRLTPTVAMPFFSCPDSSKIATVFPSSRRSHTNARTAAIAPMVFSPPDSIALLEYLRSVPSRRPRQRMTLTVATVDADGPGTKLAPTTVNRILAAVSSFYEYAIVSGLLEGVNPIEKRPDPALQRVPQRHQPFMGRASWQRPVRRVVRVKTVQKVPRPLNEAQVTALLEQLRRLRDRAIVLLMLQGGLRPGEVLGLHLETSPTAVAA